MTSSTLGDRGKYIPDLQQCGETLNKCGETLKVQYKLMVFVSFLPTDQSQTSLTHLPQIMVSIRRHF